MARAWGASSCIVLLAITVAGCNFLGRAGEGAMTTESRQVAAFSNVEAGGGINVAITIGTTASVEVRAQPNILPIIATDVEGGTLKIHGTEAYNTSEPVLVIIVTPALTRIDLSGGSQGTADGVTGDQLAVGLSGGAGLTATGSVSVLTLNVSGGARADLGGLAAETVAVNASGGANARVSASNAVSGSASGGSHVTVIGGATVLVNSSGGASVSSE